jgi:hypothetical protein
MNVYLPAGAGITSKLSFPVSLTDCTAKKYVSLEKGRSIFSSVVKNFFSQNALVVSLINTLYPFTFPLFGAFHDKLV